MLHVCADAGVNNLRLQSYRITTHTTTYSMWSLVMITSDNATDLCIIILCFLSLFDSVLLLNKKKSLLQSVTAMPYDASCLIYLRFTKTLHCIIVSWAWFHLVLFVHHSHRNNKALCTHTHTHKLYRLDVS
jgi:hypothetical protein